MLQVVVGNEGDFIFILKIYITQYLKLKSYQLTS